MPTTARIHLQLSRLEHGEDPYAARLGAQVVRRAFEDGRVADAAITWDDALLNDLAACQRPRPDAEAQGRVGQRLRAMWMELGFAEDEAVIRRGEPVELVLAFAAAELYALPWELVRIEPSGLTLADLQNVSLVWRWPGVSPAPRSPGLRPRLLFAWSAAGGRVPVEEQRALWSAGYGGAIVELANAGLGALSELLVSARAQAPFTHVVILAHGGAQAGVQGLRLEDGFADGAALQRALGAHAPSLDAVVLLSCDAAADPTPGGVLMSPAMALHRGGEAGGIRAVIGPRTPLSVLGARALSAALLPRLISAGPARALREARAALRDQGYQRDAAALCLLAPPEPERSEGPLARHNLPFPRNPDFVGYEAERAAVLAQLSPGKPTAITGLAGVGKTQLALEIASDALQSRALVLWIDASGDNLVAAMAALADDPLQLGLPTTVSAVERARAARRALEEAGPSLLVVDHLIDGDGLQEQLPRAGDCAVLLTTRRADLPRAQSVPLGGLGREESLRLLTRGEPLPPNEQAAAETLCEALGDLPLAIDLAGRSHHPPTALLARLTTRGALEVLDRARAADPELRELSLQTLFESGLAPLSAEDPVDQLALNLYRVAGWFGPERLPPALLIGAAVYIGADDPLDIEDAVERLIGLGFLRRDRDGALSMHRLVAACARREDGERARKAALESLRALCEATPTDELALLALSRLEEHLVMACANAQANDPERTLIVPLRLAQVLNLLALPKRARAVTEAALALAKSAQWKANLRHERGASLRMLGEYTLAVAESEQAVTLMVEAKAPPGELAAALHDLGWSHVALGQLAEARGRFEQALDLHEALADDKPAVEVCKDLFAMGRVALNEGRYDEALTSLTRSLEIIVALVPQGEHPQRARTLRELGVCRRLRGELLEAEALLNEAEARFARIFGADHVERALTLNELAGIRQALGDLAGAERLAQEALVALVAYAGTPWHLDVATARYQLAIILRQRGDLAGAQNQVEQALDAATRAGGQRHLIVPVLVHELGVLALGAGEPAKGVPYVERALALWRALHGGEVHPDYAAGLHTLGSLKRALGDLPGARAALTESLRLKTQLYGDVPHPDRAATLNNLGAVLLKLGELEEARRHFLMCLAMETALYGGRDNANVAMSAVNLAQVERVLGAHVAARDRLRAAAATLERTLGAEHPTTVAVNGLLPTFEAAAAAAAPANP
ncbi:MAG: tetratricopeptide repeat protein [Deltaproteobacteria bacterium]|nr:tetratricopeptide repeat protein [Deltaproteobacteria bacterium]